MKIGIIADDLTGALDTGLEFWKKGLRTMVMTSPRHLRTHARRVDVIAIDTSSRLSSTRRAREKVAGAAAYLRKHGAKYFYKKVDSTLRGNVGAEIEAVMDRLRIQTAVLAPALPEQGRTIVGGHLLVDGKRFGKTGDPLISRGESHVPTLIEEDTDMEVGSMSLPLVRGDAAREISALKKRGINIIVADATTREDLRRIAESVVKAGIVALSCGSAGLASELPVALGLCQKAPPTVVLSGSMNSVTRSQIRKIEDTLDPYVARFDPAVISRKGQRALNARVLKASEAMGDGQDIVMCLQNRRGGGLTKRDMRKALFSYCKIVNDLVSNERESGLILVGGETTSQACQAMGANTLMIEDEVDLGIPCAKILDGMNKGMRIVTKAGGFGNENSLVKAVNFLKMRRR